MSLTFKVDYAPAAPGAGAIDTKRDRMLHPLYEDAGGKKLDGWLQAVPRDGQVLGGVAGVHPGTVSKICMAFVRCGDDIRDRHLSEYGCIKATTWDRFLNTISAIHGGDGTKPITLGDLFADMDTKFSQATPAQRDMLTLRLADLESSNAVVAPPAALAAGASAADTLAYAQAYAAWEGNDKHPYAWLRALTFGDLCGDATGDLFALGRLMHALPAWTSDRVRGTPVFVRALTNLAKAAIEGTDVTLKSDAAEVAECIASRLKLIDLPRPMEGFGGSTQDAHARALAKEIRAVGTPAARRELLRERFVEVVSRLNGVRAMVGARGDGSCDLNGSACFALCAEVTTSMGITRTEDEFAWAPLRALRDEIGHLDEMLRAQPWVGRTPRDRADHVVDLHRKQAKRASAAVAAYSTPEKAAGATTESALTASEMRTRGAVPKHFQGDVGPAMSNAAFRDLKGAVLARLSQGGNAALDALQIAASGVALDASTNTPKPRVWSALMAMLAEGAAKGIDAATLDPELQMLTDAARDHWPELYGRTIGLQLAADKATLPSSLKGWTVPELAKSFSSNDWSAIDLGAAFEAGRARMRSETFKARPAEKAYTTRQSVENALEVAEPLLMLRGFGGNGRGTLPFILEEVRNTWMIFGGQGAHAKTIKKLEIEGRAYITATLEHFGRVRHSAIASKNPLAPDHERKTTLAATQRWARHLAALQAALDLHGYVAYFGDGGDSDGSDGAAGSDGNRARGSGTSGADKGKKRQRPAEIGAIGDTRGVTMSLDFNTRTLTITPKQGNPRVYLIDRMRDLAKNSKRYCVKGMAAAVLRLPERAFCDREHEDGCVEHQWAAAGATLSLCRADGAERPVKRQKKSHTRDDGAKTGGGDEGDDDDDDDAGDGGNDGDGNGDDARGDGDEAGGDAGAGAGQPPPTARGGTGPNSRAAGRGKGRGRGGKGGGRGGGRTGRKSVAFLATQKATPPMGMAGGSAPKGTNTGCTAVANRSAPTDVSVDVGRGDVWDDGRLSAPATRFSSLIGVGPAAAGAAASQDTSAPTHNAVSEHAVRADLSKEESLGRIKDPIFVQALMRLATPIDTITIGDASRHLRDASNNAGWPAISAAALPCRGKSIGFSYEGDVADVINLPGWRRAIALPDAKQQATRMGLGMAAIKAADGRLFAGMARWLYLWCVTAAAVCIVQPDIFIVDFYDAPVVITTPKAWGDDGDDLALLFWRGAPDPVPQHGDRVAVPFSDEQRSPRADALATSHGLIRGIATQLKPDSRGVNPTFGVEIERLAAAFYAAGLPVPPWYSRADAGPPEPTDRVYMLERGHGDGRRLDVHVVPRLVRRDLGDPAWCAGLDGQFTTLLRRASVPAVSPRGRALADGYRALCRADADRARRAQAEHGRAHNGAIARVRADAPGANAVAIIPGRIDGGVALLLLPNPSQSTAEVAGRALPEAHGATSEARKLITSAADSLGKALFTAKAHCGTHTAWARSALAMILDLNGISLAVVVMLAPPDVQPSPEAISEGFSWQRASAAAGLPRHTVACVAEQFIRRWVSAAADMHIAGGRTGVAEAQPTARALNAERLAPVDLAAAAREEASALAHVAAGLQDAATREPHIADALLCWREKVTTAHEFTPPALVAALGREPPATLAAKPFAHRCTIPSTPPVEVHAMAPRWPVGVPRPASMLDTYLPRAREEIRAQLDAVEQWNAVRVSGALAPRPNHKSWSDGARLPWFRGRVLWERDGRCEIIDKRLPAAQVRMHREAVLWMLRDFPHRQLVSFLVHGVTLHDDLPLQTSIAANLLSFYEVRGGPDAVAEEMHGLKERGWYRSSAGLAATADTPTAEPPTAASRAAVSLAEAATASPPRAARLLTSPARINPRGAVPRKDLGPPRGVAELGYPRRETFTVDTGEIVTSVNVATSTEHSAVMGDEFWSRKEIKPRPGDLMFNLLVLRAMGNLMRAAASGAAPATLLILFDYKYFFHALAYMAGEVWKTGCAVPARAAPGRASRTRLDVLLELVLAMGWTQASKIAQDFANALMWLLLRSVDKALAPHVAELREMSADFDAMWRGRLALEHDDYGTQARIVTALQYTDDSVKACLGATATIITIVEFCRLIGPRFYSGPDAHESARGTVARSIIDEYGEALQAWRQLAPKGSICAVGSNECAPANIRIIPTGRGTAGGNPFPVTAAQDAQRVTAGYACLLASVPGTTACEVGSLLDLQVAPGYEQLLAEQLQAHAHYLAERVLAGEHLALQCPGCRSPLRQGRCHSLLLATAVAQRCSIMLETAAGPPADPVTAPPRAAFGLDLEAAKMHKWHLGGSGIWTGVGMSSTALVTWVPQCKAARCLVEITEVLDGRCEVSRYRSLHGALADLVLPTGGGWYRMQGMAVPLQSDQELGEGPNVTVRERPQLWKRLRAWQTILANSPGAAMVSVLPAAHSATRTDVITWDIGGDAAKDGEPKQGLGAWFYGVWWCAPLGDWPVLAAAHITCLELVEVGLGIVMTTRWLGEAKRVRLRADAMAAFLTVRARREKGALSRGAKAAELVAAHEVIMQQPEWTQLHDGHREVLIEQTFGESMLLHDAASRNNVALIRDVSAALGIVPKQLELSQRARSYLHDVSRALAEVRQSAEVHIPMHATALELGTAANSAGPRTPFAQAWPGAPTAWSLEQYLQSTDNAKDGALMSASARARRALDEQRCIEATTAPSFGAPPPATWTPAPPPDFSELIDDRRAKRHASLLGSPHGYDSDDERATAFSAALARCAAGRLRYNGQGADQAAPSRAVVTARAVTPPARAVEIARAALKSTASRPTIAVTDRHAAELEESQRMLIERSIHDARCDEDGLGIRGASDELLRGLLTAAMLAVEKRFAPSTRGLDRSYWRMWTVWCDQIGTPPLRTNSAANEGRIEHLHRREVALALGAFMTWAVEAEQRGYKIESMLNRLRGVARRHWAVTIRFVSLALVVQAAQGLVREHIDAHGADSLRRRSKEPFDTAEIVAILHLPPGTVVPYAASFITVGDNLEWQGIVVFINLYCTGGWRKEAIALGAKEAFGGRKLSLGEVTYRVGGVLHREPTIPILLSITWGDMSFVNPVPCKNDPDNSKFGGSPVPSRYHATQPICLVRELAKYEIMRMRADPVGSAKTRRKELPLVLSPAGRSWSKGELSKFFDGLIRLVCSEERARQLSIHSFRVWLACALLAAGATPEQIMLMVRWSSEAARKLYARLAMSTQCSLQAGALHASFDSIRAHTLLESSKATGVSADVQAAAEALRLATGLLDTVTDESGARVATAAELRRTCSIDEDAVFSMLEEASGALEGLAVSADAAFTDASAPAPDSDSDDGP